MSASVLLFTDQHNFIPQLLRHMWLIAASNNDSFEGCMLIQCFVNNSAKDSKLLGLSFTRLHNFVKRDLIII